MSGSRSAAPSVRATALVRGRSRRPRAVVLVLVLVLLTAGCAGATTASVAQTSLSDGLEEAGSAVATAALTVALLDDGRLTAPVADTSLLDQIRVLDDASAALATLVPPAELAAPRQDGMTAVGTATDAVVAARSWVSGETGAGVPATAAEVLGALEDAQAEIDGALAAVES